MLHLVSVISSSHSPGHLLTAHHVRSEKSGRHHAWPEYHYWELQLWGEDLCPGEKRVSLDADFLPTSEHRQRASHPLLCRSWMGLDPGGFRRLWTGRRVLWLLRSVVHLLEWRRRDRTERGMRAHHHPTDAMWVFLCIYLLEFLPGSMRWWSSLLLAFWGSFQALSVMTLLLGMFSFVAGMTYICVQTLNKNTGIILLYSVLTGAAGEYPDEVIHLVAFDDLPYSYSKVSSAWPGSWSLRSDSTTPRGTAVSLSFKDRPSSTTSGTASSLLSPARSSILLGWLVESSKPSTSAKSSSGQWLWGRNMRGRCCSMGTRAPMHPPSDFLRIFPLSSGTTEHWAYTL